MALTPSTMLPLGTPAPAFTLPASDGQVVSSDDFSDRKGLLVMFICNHCPFVKHIRAGLAQFARDYENTGLAIVGISSNDTVAFPEDDLPHMKEEAQSVGYTFSYLFDEFQSVAKAYQAACTPDFFLFDADRRLVYRGRFDGSRPGNEIPVSGADLRAGVDAVLEGRPVSGDQTPSAGCNMKWIEGNAPDYSHG
jgi:peroxiredoxin